MQLVLIVAFLTITITTKTRPITANGVPAVPLSSNEPDSDQNDEIARKIIGSSVVTSVSVILNGHEPPHFSDAIGKPVPRPLVPPQVASPINLLNPDRYEFYTFNDNGELIRRLMTMQEIQSIVASGEGEGTLMNDKPGNGNELDGDNSDKNVQDIVETVHKLLNKEIEAKKNQSTNGLNYLDTPDVSASWSAILPAIFGNTGDIIVPNKPPQQVVMTPETVVVEHTEKPMKNKPIGIKQKPTKSETKRPTGKPSTKVPSKPTHDSSTPRNQITAASEIRPITIRPKPTGPSKPHRVVVTRRKIPTTTKTTTTTTTTTTEFPTEVFVKTKPTPTTIEMMMEYITTVKNEQSPIKITQGAEKTTEITFSTPSIYIPMTKVTTEAQTVTQTNPTKEISVNNKLDNDSNTTLNRKTMTTNKPTTVEMKIPTQTTKFSSTTTIKEKIRPTIQSTTTNKVVNKVFTKKTTSPSILSETPTSTLPYITTSTIDSTTAKGTAQVTMKTTQVPLTESFIAEHVTDLPTKITLEPEDNLIRIDVMEVEHSPSQQISNEHIDSSFNQIVESLTNNIAIDNVKESVNAINNTISTNSTNIFDNRIDEEANSDQTKDVFMTEHLYVEEEEPSIIELQTTTLSSNENDSTITTDIVQSEEGTEVNLEEQSKPNIITEIDNLIRENGDHFDGLSAESSANLGYAQLNELLKENLTMSDFVEQAATIASIQMGDQFEESHDENDTDDETIKESFSNLLSQMSDSLTTIGPAIELVEATTIINMEEPDSNITSSPKLTKTTTEVPLKENNDEKDEEISYETTVIKETSSYSIESSGTSMKPMDDVMIRIPLTEHTTITSIDSEEKLDITTKKFIENNAEITETSNHGTEIFEIDETDKKTEIINVNNSEKGVTQNYKDVSTLKPDIEDNKDGSKLTEKYENKIEENDEKNQQNFNYEKIKVQEENNEQNRTDVENKDVTNENHNNESNNSSQIKDANINLEKTDNTQEKENDEKFTSGDADNEQLNEETTINPISNGDDIKTDKGEQKEDDSNEDNSSEEDSDEEEEEEEISHEKESQVEEDRKKHNTSDSSEEENSNETDSEEEDSEEEHSSEEEKPNKAEELQTVNNKIEEKLVLNKTNSENDDSDDNAVQPNQKDTDSVHEKEKVGESEKPTIPSEFDKDDSVDEDNYNETEKSTTEFTNKENKLEINKTSEKEHSNKDGDEEEEEIDENKNETTTTMNKNHEIKIDTKPETNTDNSDNIASEILDAIGMIDEDLLAIDGENTTHKDLDDDDIEYDDKDDNLDEQDHDEQFNDSKYPEKQDGKHTVHNNPNDDTTQITEKFVESSTSQEVEISTGKENYISTEKEIEPTTGKETTDINSQNYDENENNQITTVNPEANDIIITTIATASAAIQSVTTISPETDGKHNEEYWLRYHYFEKIGRLDEFLAAERENLHKITTILPPQEPDRIHETTEKYYEETTELDERESSDPSEVTTLESTITENDTEYLTTEKEDHREVTSITEEPKYTEQVYDTTTTDENEITTTSDEIRTDAVIRDIPLADSTELSKDKEIEVRTKEPVKSEVLIGEEVKITNTENKNPGEQTFIKLGETTTTSSASSETESTQLRTNSSTTEQTISTTISENSTSIPSILATKQPALKINDETEDHNRSPTFDSYHPIYRPTTEYEKPIQTKSTTHQIKLPPSVSTMNIKLPPTISLANRKQHPIQLEPAPKQSLGLEESTAEASEDILDFTRLCNELAFTMWRTLTSEGISSARSLVFSPFGLTSMLAMVFLGARGSTSGEMNEMLKLDDMVTFNPHLVFRNITDSVEDTHESGLASGAFVRELFSDRTKGKILTFYKDKAQQFYAGHVEEVNFGMINDIIRRRTNLLVKRHTWGKISEYLKTNNIWMNSPLAGISANIYQTDCFHSSFDDRDGEMFFQVLPAIRQRRLVPIPATLWRSGFTAGYDAELDATIVAFGHSTDTVSTIYIMPGQQGHSTPGDNLERLETALMLTGITKNSWHRLLRTLIERPGLEVQIPRFSHRSFINATHGLQKMGLTSLFDFDHADLRGLTGSTTKDMYISDMVQVNTFSTCGEDKIGDQHHIEMYPAPPIQKRTVYYNEYTEQDVHETDPIRYQLYYDPLFDTKYMELPLPLRPRQARIPSETPRLRFDRPFLYFVRHNPTGMILYMGRFNPRLLP